MNADFPQRLARIKCDIDRVARQCGHDAADVKILAVSKGHDFSAIQEAYDCGLRDFGESYAQEMQKKIKLAIERGLRDVRWHFIGAIQSNKIKLISQADVIHSVASVRQATLIGEHCTSVKSIFCQIGLGQERIGFKPLEIIDALRAIAKIKNLRVLGLMTILPLMPKNPPEVWFEEMRTLKASVLASGALAEIKLSMGMSHDFLPAIKYGANIVRIGTALFGSRDEAPDISPV